MGPPMRGGYHYGPPSYHDGRGMDRGPLRRSRSRSLGRYSPGRSPVRGPSGLRKRKAPGSPGGSYSTDSKSSGSYSTTDSETDSKSPHRQAVRPRPTVDAQPVATGPPAQVADQGTIKKELVQAKRRESELASRMAALEAEVKSTKAAREDQTAKLTEFTERLQLGVGFAKKSEDTIKQYRKWLLAMCNYTRDMLASHEAVTAAKEDLRLRVEDLALFLQETENFITAEKGKSGRRRRKDAAEGNAVEGGEAIPSAAVAPETIAAAEVPIEAKPLTLPAVTIPNGV